MSSFDKNFMLGFGDSVIVNNLIVNKILLR
jgi:hypothetical protein